MTQPLPPAAQDPSVIRGYAVRQEWLAGIQRINADQRITDLVKAEQIAALWTKCNDELVSLYGDLQARQRARIAALDKVVPLGPAIPVGASAADTVVLQQAFRATLAEARNADSDGLRSMLADAEKFEDDNLQRAVLTAAAERADINLVRAWTELHGVTDQFDELIATRDALAGAPSTDRLMTIQALKPIEKPTEVTDLPALQQAAELAATNARRGLSR